MTPIPFSLPDDGFDERKGTVRISDGFLVVQFQTAFMGEWNKQEKIVKIEPRALDDLYLKKGVFKDTMCLVPRDPDVFKKVPGVVLGELKLNIWRKHRSACRELIDAFDRLVVGF